MHLLAGVSSFVHPSYPSPLFLILAHLSLAIISSLGAALPPALFELSPPGGDSRRGGEVGGTREGYPD